jgi:hypothetical protein
MRGNRFLLTILYCSAVMCTVLFFGDLRACTFCHTTIIGAEREPSEKICLERADLAKEQGAISDECAVLSSKNILQFSQQQIESAQRALCSGIIHMGCIDFRWPAECRFIFLTATKAVL